MYTYVAIACLLGVAVAAPSMPIVDSVSIPHYSFNYAVNDPITGDNKAQTEHREGGHVKGSYSLSEPDGTIRVVDYSADPHTGFNAVVKRLGHAVHPQPIMKAVAPIAHVAPIAVAPAIATSAMGWGHGAHGLGHGDMGHGLGAHGLDHGSWGHDFGAHGADLHDHGFSHGSLGFDLGAHSFGHGFHGLGLGAHGFGLGAHDLGLGDHGHSYGGHGLGYGAHGLAYGAHDLGYGGHGDWKH